MPPSASRWEGSALGLGPWPGALDPAHYDRHTEFRRQLRASSSHLLFFFCTTVSASTAAAVLLTLQAVPHTRPPSFEVHPRGHQRRKKGFLFFFQPLSAFFREKYLGRAILGLISHRQTDPVGDADLCLSKDFFLLRPSRSFDQKRG